jgi:ketosteroid isomerase-like protein
MDTEQQLKKLVEDWASAELRGDVSILGPMLTDNFIGIGSRGFMLTKEQWLARYTSGDFGHESLSWDEVQVRVHGDAAIVTGRETMKGRYKDQSVQGQSRATQVLVKQNEHWLLAAIQLSPIGGGP